MTPEEIEAQKEVLQQERALLEQQQRILEESRELFERQKQNLSYDVYDEAKTKLIRWSSVLGGAVAIVAGLVGYLSFEYVVERLAGNRIQSIADLQLSPVSSQISALETRVQTLDGRPQTIGAQLDAIDSQITRSRNTLIAVEDRLTTLNDQLRGQNYPKAAEIVKKEYLQETLRNREPFVLYNLDAWGTVCGDGFATPEKEVESFGGFGQFWIVFDSAFQSGRRFQTHDRIRLSSFLRGNIFPDNFHSEIIADSVCSNDAFYSNSSHSYLPFQKDMRELPGVVGFSLGRVSIERDSTGKIKNTDSIAQFRGYWENYDRALIFLGVNGANYTLSNDPDFFLSTERITTSDDVVRLDGLQFLEDNPGPDAQFLYAIYPIAGDDFRLQTVFE